MVGGKSAWRASELLARHVLEELGYRILEVHKRILLGESEVGEVDVLAEKGGRLYAVEVKAGLVDPSGVRQAYVNALLLNASPLIVARGADEGARILAERLGVELLILPDAVYAGIDDLYLAVREAVFDAVWELLSVFDRCGELAEGDLEILRALSGGETIRDAAETLGASEEEVARMIAGLRRRGLVPRGNYRMVRLAARLLLLCTGSFRSVPRP